GAANEYAVRLSSLHWREPARETARRIREGSGLACAEQESDQNKRAVIPCSAGKHGEARPPQDNPGQDPPRTHDVTHPPRGNLKQGIGEGKRAEDNAHLKDREAEVPHHEGRRCRNTYPVQVCNDGESK